MKLGILNALPGHYILAGELSDIEKFERLIKSVDAEIECVSYDATVEELPGSPQVCDAFLVTGSPCGVSDGDPWIATLAEFIQQAYAEQKKMVGICFGHQLIAQALGGQVRQSNDGWLLGLHRIELRQQPAWLSPPRPEFSLYFINQDQVVTLPPGAELIASNQFCPHTMFTLKDQVLGLQAHIEHSAAFMRTIIHYLEAQLTPHKRAEVLRSIEQSTPDDQLVARWVVNFIKAST